MLLVALGVASLAVSASAASASFFPPFGSATALPPHPRLRVNDSHLAAINSTIRTDPTAKAYFDGLVVYGEALLTAPLVNASKFAMTEARSTLTREYNLGLLWRLTGDDRFAARAAQELLHITTNCSTWDPAGLTLAETVHAVGIGYDWLYEYLSPAQRHTIVAGIARLGFDEALAKYPHAFWANCSFNWGMVTNGGLAIGALAFLDEPAATVNASAVLSKALAGLSLPFSSFAPHGAWHEGSMYWGYTSEYAVATTEALRGVYGSDDGLSAASGFNETALFRLHMNGPSQNSFDFGDSNGFVFNEGSDPSLFMGYAQLPTSNSQLRSLCAYEGRRLAKIVAGYTDSNGDTKYNCSGIFESYLYNNTVSQQQHHGRMDCSYLLMHFSPAGTDAEIQALPTAQVFKLSAYEWDGRDAVGFFRSAWSTETEGTSGKHSYLAFKAANGLPNHNDLDGGTFVFEAGGQRWAMDMASGDYSLRNYFSQSLKWRYGYYRKSTAGHNTLTFDNDGLDNSNRGACDQDPGPNGITAITLFAGRDTIPPQEEDHGAPAAAAAGVGSRSNSSASSSSSSSSPPAYAIVDLTAAYGPQSSSRIERGFAFTESYEHLLIVDEFVFAAGSTVRNVTWTMHTMAAIKLPAAAATAGAAGGNAAGSAVLSLGGAKLYATVIEPPGGVFSAAAVDLLPPQKPSSGVSKLEIHLNLNLDAAAAASAAAADDDAVPAIATPPVARIVVGLSLSAAATAVTPNPLAQWKADGPFAAGDWN